MSACAVSLSFSRPGVRQPGDQGLGGFAVVQHAGDHGVAEVQQDLRAALHGNAGGHGGVVRLNLSAILRYAVIALGEGQAQDEGKGQQGNHQDHYNALHTFFLLVNESFG